VIAARAAAVYGTVLAGRVSGISPDQPGALMRLQVDRLPLPPGGTEEHADTCLAFGVAVMHDMPEDQVSWIDQDACFLPCFADHALDHGLAGLQVPAGRSARVPRFPDDL